MLCERSTFHYLISIAYLRRNQTFRTKDRKIDLRLEKFLKSIYFIQTNEGAGRSN